MKKHLEIYEASNRRLNICGLISPTRSLTVDLESQDSVLVVKLKDIGGICAREHEYRFAENGNVMEGTHNIKDPFYGKKKDYYSIDSNDPAVLIGFGRQIKKILDMYKKNHKISEHLSSHPIVYAMENLTLEKYLKNNAA